MADRVVGIGASAGGVDALTSVVRELPADFPAAICIVLHVPSSGRSLLASILGRQTALDVVEAEDDQPIENGRVYVAPNDRHLIVSADGLHLDRGPKENGVRPAVDVMLRTLAGAFGPRSIAVVLSGALGDGSAGALAVRRAGGQVLIQDPEDATVPSMPESALRAVDGAATVLRAREIGAALARLVDAGPKEEDAVMTESGNVHAETPERPDGPPSPFTCPECSGSLWELEDGREVRYRCRVGHSYSEDAMIIEQGSAVEAALWSALEALEERAEFLRRIASRHHGEHRARLRDRFNRAAEDALERANLIRTALGTLGERPHALDPQAEVSE